MNVSLQILFDKIEAQRQQMMSSVRHLDAERLNKNIIPGKWSVAEILSHLIAAERLSLTYLNKKILAIESASDSGLWEEVKINLLKISQRLPGLKFKVPKTLQENMTVHKSLEALETEWAQVRSELRIFLDKVPDNRVDRLIYRHVRAGYLNTKHALIFFREHAIHHTPQIKRLVNHM